MRAVLDHVHAVDPHVLDADRELMRFFEGGAVAHGGGIEEDHVRVEALAQQASITETQALGNRVATGLALSPEFAEVQA